MLEHGLADVSLRPLAAAIGSSPRVLIFLFDSKDGLVRALLARARGDELDLLDHLRLANAHDAPPGLPAAVAGLWQWLIAEERRPLLTLWVESYGRSLVDPDGPWGEFARDTVVDWLDVLAASQYPEERETPEGEAQRTLTLAVLRGALLDLLATRDPERTTAGIHRYLAGLGP